MQRWSVPCTYRTVIQLACARVGGNAQVALVTAKIRSDHVRLVTIGRYIYVPMHMMESTDGNKFWWIGGFLQIAKFQTHQMFSRGSQ